MNQYNETTRAGRGGGRSAGGAGAVRMARSDVTLLVTARVGAARSFLREANVRRGGRDGGLILGRE